MATMPFGMLALIHGMITMFCMLHPIFNVSPFLKVKNIRSEFCEILHERASEAMCITDSFRFFHTFPTPKNSVRSQSMRWNFTQHSFSKIASHDINSSLFSHFEWWNGLQKNIFEVQKNFEVQSENQRCFYLSRSFKVLFSKIMVWLCPSGADSTTHGQWVLRCSLESQFVSFSKKFWPQIEKLMFYFRCWIKSSSLWTNGRIGFNYRWFYYLQPRGSVD